MKFSHYIVLHGVRVLVQLDINVDALANDLGAKAADNASGKAAVRFGNVKASIGKLDLALVAGAQAEKRAAQHYARGCSNPECTYSTCRMAREAQVQS